MDQRIRPLSLPALPEAPARPVARARRVLPALALGLLLLAACENKVTESSFTQITTGMSLSQVEKLLGGSGKDDTSHAGISITGGGVGSSSAATEKTYVWSAKGLTIQVIFKDGKVVSKNKFAS